MTTYNKQKVELVQFDQGDIPGLIELSGSVGWDYDEREIGTVLSSGKLFGHRNSEGKIVSSAAIIPYETEFASLGMVIVHKDFRGLGLGKIVTQKCIDSVSSSTSVMLIATEEGKPLYEKMGFQTVDCVHKYLCDDYSPLNGEQSHNSKVTIETFNEHDFIELVMLDEAAFRDKRSTLLRQRIKQSEQCLVAKNDKGCVIGFGLSIQGPVNLIIGPVVAPTSHTAAIIVDRLAIDHRGKRRIDVPSGNDEWLSFLEERGFKKVSQPPVMMKNSERMLSRNHTLFGIAAQVFG
ncbi:GNAT family N-acetyltransferase [Rossellomorea sp. NS-SX7]|uniref:GNAT family N-acetyltransferase n=1 Tax=Rossellomorea sp. NS-SX7 TaxID=3463856 RepID=UPI004057D432